MGREVSTPCPVAVRGVHTVPQPAALQREVLLWPGCGGGVTHSIHNRAIGPAFWQLLFSPRLPSSQQAAGLMSGCSHTVGF